MSKGRGHAWSKSESQVRVSAVSGRLAWPGQAKRSGLAYLRAKVLFVGWHFCVLPLVLKDQKKEVRFARSRIIIKIITAFTSRSSLHPPSHTPTPHHKVCLLNNISHHFAEASPVSITTHHGGPVHSRAPQDDIQGQEHFQA